MTGRCAPVRNQMVQFIIAFCYLCHYNDRFYILGDNLGLDDEKNVSFYQTEDLSNHLNLWDKNLIGGA